jgi:hypothetical protein
MTTRRLGITAMLLVAFSLTPAGAPAQEPVSFPEVEGDNLEGKPFILPQDFEGELNLALIAFQREQQADVDTWLSLGAELEEAYVGFRYYELPTIYKANKAVRWFINNGMRRGIKDPGARARTITLYLDKPKFRKSLGLPHEGQIYALLVNADGQVIWRAGGLNSKAKRLDLEKNIAKILERADRPSEKKPESPGTLKTDTLKT